MSNLLSPEFWNNEWLKFRQKNSYIPYRKEQQAQDWNERADSFAKKTIFSSNNQRVNDVFTFLKNNNVLQPGMRILDIGCGPGTFAIPFVKMGLQVTAIDPADKMLSIIKNSISEEYLSRIELINALWEDYDINKTNWKNHFDLVFASMSPGISNLDSIKKMIYCSRNWCFISGFSGVRQFELYDTIWNSLFNKKFQEHFNDIIFPFNIVYCLGYKPTISFKSSYRTHSEQLEQLFSKIKESASQEKSLTDDDIFLIRDILLKNSENGIVKHNVYSTIGMMLFTK